MCAGVNNPSSVAIRLVLRAFSAQRALPIALHQIQQLTCALSRNRPTFASKHDIYPEAYLYLFVNGAIVAAETTFVFVGNRDGQAGPHRLHNQDNQTHPHIYGHEHR